MLNEDIIDVILMEYMTVYDIYLINNKYYNYYKEKLNKNILIIQKFSRTIDIPINIKHILNEDISNLQISEYYIKRYWVRNYPIEYIPDMLNLAIKKLPRFNYNSNINNLKKLLDQYNDHYEKKNLNYYLNQYIKILNIEELDCNGW